MDYQFQLRPHHGMCMAFFQGKGYSSEFTAHMAETIQQLGDETMVRICAQTDVICGKCPNNQSGTCETERKVAEYDRQVLERCGLADGAVLPYGQFRGAVQENILGPGSRKEICGDCQWNELCMD